MQNHKTVKGAPTIIEDTEVKSTPPVIPITLENIQKAADILVDEQVSSTCIRRFIINEHQHRRFEKTPDPFNTGYYYSTEASSNLLWNRIQAVIDAPKNSEDNEIHLSEYIVTTERAQLLRNMCYIIWMVTLDEIRSTGEKTSKALSEIYERIINEYTKTKLKLKDITARIDQIKDAFLHYLMHMPELVARDNNKNKIILFAESIHEYLELFHLFVEYPHDGSENDLVGPMVASEFKKFHDI